MLMEPEPEISTVAAANAKTPPQAAGSSLFQSGPEVTALSTVTVAYCRTRITHTLWSSPFQAYRRGFTLSRSPLTDSTFVTSQLPVCSVSPRRAMSSTRSPAT
jgi:hypothetical protein